MELFFNIYSYRVKCALSGGDIPQAVADVATARLNAYRQGTLDLVALKAAMGPALRNDQIHAILADVE